MRRLSRSAGRLCQRDRARLRSSSIAVLPLLSKVRGYMHVMYRYCESLLGFHERQRYADDLGFPSSSSNALTPS